MNVMHQIYQVPPRSLPYRRYGKTLRHVGPRQWVGRAMRLPMLTMRIALQIPGFSVFSTGTGRYVPIGSWWAEWWPE